jgi:hypothetical protein
MIATPAGAGSPPSYGEDMSDMKVEYQFTKYDITTDEQPTDRAISRSCVPTPIGAKGARVTVRHGKVWATVGLLVFLGWLATHNGGLPT